MFLCVLLSCYLYFCLCVVFVHAFVRFIVRLLVFVLCVVFVYVFARFIVRLLVCVLCVFVCVCFCVRIFCLFLFLSVFVNFLVRLLGLPPITGNPGFQSHLPKDKS